MSWYPAGTIIRSTEGEVIARDLTPENARVLGSVLHLMRELLVAIDADAVDFDAWAKAARAAMAQTDATT